LENVMTVYRPGQRVVLTRTEHPYSDLRPGDTGTVRNHDVPHRIVQVDWDNGSTQDVHLDAGDRVADETAVGAEWALTLDRLRAAAAAAGRDVAERWAENTIGGRATGDGRATARRVLTGVADGDPAVLDGMPTFTPPIRWYDGRDMAEVRYVEAAADGAPAWRDLTGVQRARTIAASRDAFDDAVVERAVELCQLVASPTGRDLSHLHPDNVRIGSAGVFAGDWAQTVGTGRIGVGFVGTLVDTWNGWAVFTCTREVAEAIVAEQRRYRSELREIFEQTGIPEQELDRRVDEEATDLYFDGDDIVADQRVMWGEPDAVERISPDDEGRYVVMGWAWCWEAVDPYDCDRVVGDVPEPGRQQQWVRLPHTGLRVPHDRLKVTALRRTPVHNSPAYTATLTLDGEPVGHIRNDGTGGDTDLAFPTSRWGEQHMADYAAACRRHGQPVPQQQVLEALATECEVNEAIRAAETAGDALARLIDTNENIRELRTITPAPRSPREVLDLGRTLTRGPDQRWQIWAGATWFTLPGALAQPH
jgi:hypothetical protein